MEREVSYSVQALLILPVAVHSQRQVPKKLAETPMEYRNDL